MDLDGANIGRFADGVRTITINVAGDWIYFTDAAAIYKIRTDGTELTKLCDIVGIGVPSDIDLNVLNDWVYLTSRGFNTRRVGTDGGELQEVT